MGITYKSAENSVVKKDSAIKKTSPDDKIIAVAGNPNVGKSTLFNALTGLRQHTGNWPGKTVINAKGRYTYKGKSFILVDIPGTYSLMSTSPEEKIARDFICFGDSDTVLVVADATCLERNLNLVLQILEITQNVVVCVNLLDEAKKKKIQIDLSELSLKLGVPVVGTSARSKNGLTELMDRVYDISCNKTRTCPIKLNYGYAIETAISLLSPDIEKLVGNKINPRWLSLKLINVDDDFRDSLFSFLGFDILTNPLIINRLDEINLFLSDREMKKEFIHDIIVSAIVKNAENIYKECVFLGYRKYNFKDRKIDKILTSTSTGIPVMLILLGLIFWITIVGANYPSTLISNFLFGLENRLIIFFANLGTPVWLYEMLILGVYRTVSWVVSVMLPPMAIFFPLFTLLEDLGYLPRIAFNMDSFFKKACAHGKQALTMCMGFGCNACGVIGCRIIESPRERLIAIITNNFVPCNGRFPTLIAIITMFFAGTWGTPLESIISSLILISVIVLGIIMTLLVSKILSKTILKGIPSSFILELPPYRTPQIGKVIIRSIFDRTLFVLGRAIVTAAPAGLVIWLLSNISIGDISLLNHCTNFLNPFAQLIGLDGVILTAFILAFPANELVFPIIIMTYLSNGSITELESLSELKQLLVNNGWTYITAICTMLFSLLHFPCGTTCLTIKKETGSLKWTLVSFIVPTVIGISVCFVVANLARLFMF